MTHLEQALQQRTANDALDFTYLAGAPYVFHCHHYNLFHDQTVDDALGEQAGWQVRFAAAHHAFRELLSSVFDKLSVHGAKDRVELAQQLFAAMGQGKLELPSDAQGGLARGTHLHYGFSWKEKYGGRVRRDSPADAVAAGFAASVVELANGLEAGSIVAREIECVGMRNAQCTFSLDPRTASAPPTAVTQEVIEPLSGAPFGGLDEARISAIAGGLRDFLRAVGGDARGLVQAFSVFVTAHLSNYYNETIYESAHRIERTSPRSIDVAEQLFSEAGSVCVFNTFGNVLLSPEWEGLVGAPSGDPFETVSSCMAIARGLGFGHWTIGEYSPGKTLVLRAPSVYESPFYRARYGRSERPRCYVATGAALAIAVLAEKIDWRDRPELTHELYVQLFRNKSQWHVQQTLCPTRGDAMVEVVVTAKR